LKSLLRYPGGKTRALKHIIPYFPKNLTEIVSPFFGGGSIEIHYASQGVRVHGYEIFEPLVNFWQQVLEDSGQLAFLLDTVIHPCSKEMFSKFQKQQFWDDRDETHEHLMWRELRACMYYALNRSSFSGATTSGGYSQQAADKRFTESSIERLKNFSCPSLTMEHADFKDSLSRHDDNTFIYADPPYAIENPVLYGKNGSTHKDFDHLGLAAAMKQKNNWVLSYNPSPFILDLYKDYKIVYPEWSYGMSKDKKSKEILILNTEGKS
jgi:DNA adenine methylase